jgi:hypothetical protein
MTYIDIRGMGERVHTERHEARSCMDKGKDKDLAQSRELHTSCFKGI